MARLNYHHLYYFWKVASQGNLTQAARSLCVSQSALSAQIRQLENTMDVRLFERSGRKLVLTQAGARVFAYASDIFKRGEELESILQHGVETELTFLRIGVLNTMSRNFIEAFIAPLLSDPNVRYSLTAKGQANLLEGLVQHQFDLVLTNINVSGSDERLWQSQMLARQPLAVVGPPGLELGDTFPEGFDQYRWILPGGQSEIRQAFEGFCAPHQFEPNVLAEADDMAMLRLLARDSGALTVLPKVVVRDELNQGVLKSYVTLPNVYEHFYAVSIKRQYIPPVMKELLNRDLQIET